MVAPSRIRSSPHNLSTAPLPTATTQERGDPRHSRRVVQQPDNFRSERNPRGA